jgi:hypothetical protein
MGRESWKTKSRYVGFEVLAAVDMKNFIFWDITQCSLLKVNRRFEGNVCCSACCLLHACFLLLALFFGPENGEEISFRNLG